ncbi:MAG: amidohydrolase [Deltaproteobacteria bacterium]|nr:amidohydrolase [Deltaproteobacteria bacterium]MBW2724420.1 amidohydrolase [Deltaproteobacteria bacterium]
MQLEDMIMVSVDDHVVEPPDMFENHLTVEYKAKAPKNVRLPSGCDVWEFNGQQLPNIGLNAVVGRVPEEYGVEPTSYEQMRKGCYDIHARIEDMNANGVLASICFPSFPGFVGQLWGKTEDKKLATVMLQAYNDWHIDEWCGTYPGRFIPLALPCMWDQKLMVEEVKRVARKGCTAVSFSENPDKLGFPTLHDEYWDPLWKVCADEGMVICVHIGSAAGMSFPTMDSPVDVMIATTPISIINVAADLLFSKILRRHPTLKFALSEGGIGWVPYFLERVDYVYSHHKAWTHQDFGKQLPSDCFRDHILNCFIDDKAGIAMRDKIGTETIFWESDYPHSDTTWPNSPEVLWESLEKVSDADINAMTYENAMREFRLDFHASRPKEKSTVAALRAESPNVDMSPIKNAGGTAAHEDGNRIVTGGDIMRQLAGAFVERN